MRDSLSYNEIFPQENHGLALPTQKWYALNARVPQEPWDAVQF